MKKVIVLVVALCLAFAGAAFADSSALVIQGQTSTASQCQTGPGVQASASFGTQSYSANLGDCNKISGTTTYFAGGVDKTCYGGGFTKSSGSALQGGFITVDSGHRR